jgi:hypothetical protein
VVLRKAQTILSVLSGAMKVFEAISTVGYFTADRSRLSPTSIARFWSACTAISILSPEEAAPFEDL